MYSHNIIKKYGSVSIMSCVNSDFQTGFTRVFYSYCLQCNSNVTQMFLGFHMSFPCSLWHKMSTSIALSVVQIIL